MVDSAQRNINFSPMPRVTPHAGQPRSQIPGDTRAQVPSLSHQTSEANHLYDNDYTREIRLFDRSALPLDAVTTTKADYQAPPLPAPEQAGLRPVYRPNPNKLASTTVRGCVSIPRAPLGCTDCCLAFPSLLLTHQSPDCHAASRRLQRRTTLNGHSSGRRLHRRHLCSKAAHIASRRSRSRTRTTRRRRLRRLSTLRHSSRIGPTPTGSRV